ncbi:LapA family protein [Cognatishimia sp. WU-CL00825]|uniref:LapA family protein n=1 Tax=Cognatishimia sp. WU-CL00825 TaxID=3127658 RepID=UPI00310731ED
MRYIRYGFLAALGVVLVSVALANRGMVTLNLLPEPLAELLGLGYSISLPLFVVIFAGIVAGLLIGFFWEWMREHKHRAAAGRAERSLKTTQREVRRLKGARAEDKDEVLVLLEEAS